MKQLREGDDFDEILEMFAQMIQSGKDVTLDDHTRIIFYAFIPPVEYRSQLHYLYFLIVPVARVIVRKLS